MLHPLFPIVVSEIFALIVIYPLARICLRAGLPLWPAFVVFVPIIGPPITAYLLAASRWPGHPFGR
tara:strand:+ start:51 stop:248 length:198 start_codon:yes stop_codon:yes gene_type:complete